MPYISHSPNCLSPHPGTVFRYPESSLNPPSHFHPNVTFPEQLVAHLPSTSTLTSLSDLQLGCSSPHTPHTSCVGILLSPEQTPTVSRPRPCVVFHSGVALGCSSVVHLSKCFLALYAHAHTHIHNLSRTYAHTNTYTHPSESHKIG